MQLFAVLPLTSSNRLNSRLLAGTFLDLVFFYILYPLIVGGILSRYHIIAIPHETNYCKTIQSFSVITVNVMYNTLH